MKTSVEKYEKPNFPPQLEWFDVHRGQDKAGELLAAFELLQVRFIDDSVAIYVYHWKLLTHIFPM